MRHPFFLIPFIALFVMTVGCSRSSDLESENIDTINAVVESTELSNQRVTAFAEDAAGYVWIGTFRGLNRFNSHQYRQFFCTDSPDDLPDNQITHLFKDSTGRLWVATISGVAYHNVVDKFTLVPFGDHRPYVGYMFETPDGRILALSEGRVGEFNPEKECFDVLIDSRRDKFHDYGYGCVGPGGNIWLGASDAIDVFDASGKNLIESISLESPAIYFYRCPVRNHIWVGTPAGMRIFDMVSRREIDLPAPLAQNPSIAHGYCSLIHGYDDKSILIYIGADGLYLYNQVTGRLLRHDDEGFPFDVPDYINCLYTDKHGNLWIGSYDKGFEVRSIGKKRFNDNHFLTSHVANHSINSVSADSKDRLWMATIPANLYLYDRVAGTFVKDLDPERLASTVFVDSNDNIWLGSLLSGRVRRCAYDGTRLSVLQTFDIDRPMAFASDHKGNIWVAGGTGLVTRISPDGHVDQVTLHSSGQYFVSTLTQRGDKMLVAALMSPMYEIGIDDLSVNEGPLGMDDWGKVLRRSVFIPTHVVCDSYNDVWIGTVGNGLLRYHAEKDSVERMHGLPCTDISSIVEDRQGGIWVSSMYGLSSYDRTTDRFSNYFTADGTGGNQFYDRSACILSDGELVFGATHGLTTFNPLDMVSRNEIPLVFDGLKIHNTPVDPSAQPEVIDRAMPTKPHITLEHDQNGFGISFAALDYQNSEHSHYFYMLDGHDKYWIDAGNSNEAYYANLPTGDYTFRVKASFGSSDAAGEEISVPITVKPAPWFSWWAILLYVLGGIALLWFILSMRKRYLMERRSRFMAESERAQQQRLNDMNMSFFANISHEFRTPLTMISGPVSQLENGDNLSAGQRRMISVIKHNVSRMLRLINQLMDFNRLENDTLKLQVEHIDVMVYLRSIAENFGVNTSAKNISLHTSGMEEDFVAWVDIDKIEKITANLLSNALKFTPSGGEICFDFDVVDAAEAHRCAQAAGIDFSPNASCMKITVKDTGTGIPQDRLNKIFDRYYQLENQKTHGRNWGSGIGLYYSRALALLHHGTLFAGNRDDAECVTGSVFTLLLPLGEDAYAKDEHITASAQAPLPAPVKVQESQEVADDGSERPKILVVDDDTDVIHYLRELLSGEFSIITAFDAESALKVIYDEHPDLIISDVVMPGVDGYDFCRRIKEDIQICHTPMILVTAKATIENQVQGLNTGADAYVTKPFDPNYLLALIHSQLNNRKRARSIINNATETTDIAADVLTGADKAFMNELYSLMQSELSNTELDITRITDHLHISRSKLFYKIKALTGETPGAFFKTYKLNRAVEFIREGKYSMAEIADMTGFSTQAHFSTSFKKQFGVTPSAYITASQP